MSISKHKNFALSTVAVAPSPASSGLSLVVQTGDGALFPTGTFPAVVYPNGSFPTAANAEVVTASVSGDTFTLVRAQEGSAARTIVVGDVIDAGITAGVLQAAEANALSQTFRGLVLRTHPDADKALSQTWCKFDEVVFDDGTHLAGAAALVCDVTVSGLNGLDTGSEGASRWYEQYVIAKDDGTLGCLLHRAKDYLKDQALETASNNANQLRVFTATATDKLAQGVQFATAGKLEFIDPVLDRDAALTGRVWFSIQADSAGNPSGTPLATTDKLDASSLSTVNAFVRFVFRTPYTVATSTQYHLVMEGDYTRSDTATISWRGVTAGGYANGSAKKYNGTTWSAAAPGDFDFRAYVTENDTAVTMPSGYTKKCLVGYVYNGSGSDFVLFLQRQRRVVPMANQGTGIYSNTVSGMFDISALVPPVPVRIVPAGANNTADTFQGVAGVPDGYKATIAGSDYRSGGHSRPMTWHGGQADATIIGDEVQTEYQAIYCFVNAGNGQTFISSWEW